MQRLTPNLWAHSAFTHVAASLESRQLDFNLARRSGIVINRIIGQLWQTITTTTGHGVALAAVQEVDVDPDNVDIEFAGATNPDGVVLDSSRCFRQRIEQDRDTAAGAQSPYQTLLQKDWGNLDVTRRPISITPLRHHVRSIGDIAMIVYCEVAIDYFIVELSLEELGIINASRR